MFDSLRCCDVDKLQKQRRDFIEAELVRYMRNTFFKNYEGFSCEFFGLNHFDVKTHMVFHITIVFHSLINDLKYKLEVSINFGGFGTNRYVDVDDVKYAFYEQSNIINIAPLFLFERAFKHVFGYAIENINKVRPFNEQLIPGLAEFRSLNFYGDLINLLTLLYDKNYYKSLTSNIKRKYNKIYFTNYYTCLKNIILILCQAKYHRCIFPYDIVKIIARKLMT